MNLTDEELIAKISKGDSKAFASLMLRHKNKVFGFCVKILGDRKMAEDMAQETWIRVVQGAPQFESRAKVCTWIIAIARNLCLNEIRRRN